MTPTFRFAHSLRYVPTGSPHRLSGSPLRSLRKPKYQRHARNKTKTAEQLVNTCAAAPGGLCRGKLWRRRGLNREQVGSQARRLQVAVRLFHDLFVSAPTHLSREFRPSLSAAVYSAGGRERGALWRLLPRAAPPDCRYLRERRTKYAQLGRKKNHENYITKSKSRARGRIRTVVQHQQHKHTSTRRSCAHRHPPAD